MKITIDTDNDSPDELYAAKVAIQSYLNACSYAHQDDTAQKHVSADNEPVCITMLPTLEVQYLKQRHPDYTWAHNDQEDITADKIVVPENFVSCSHAARVDWLKRYVS